MHNESNGDTIPLAAHRKALREAYVEARMIPIVEDNRADAWRAAYEREALARWPEPEPELRWVKADANEYARDAQGAWHCRAFGLSDCVFPSVVDDRYVRALASLLPREPVAVTEAMVARAKQAYLTRNTGTHEDAIRAALLAVAADLAGPVGEKPKATRWGVMDNKGDLFIEDSKSDAEKTAERWDERNPHDAPHRVVGLAEVEA